LVLGLVIVVIAVWVVVVFIREVLDRPRQAYAVWWTADLVIAYMDRHDGAWPAGWDDLRPLAEAAPEVAEATGPDASAIIEFRPKASIEDLQSRVEIDWSANPDELLKAARHDSGPPFRVIYLRNGRAIHYEGREPNQMILEYLELRHRRKARQGAERGADANRRTFLGTLTRTQEHLDYLIRLQLARPPFGGIRWWSTACPAGGAWPRCTCRWAAATTAAGTATA
jgi:hypothetical protein